MTLTVSSKREYIPEFNGNKDESPSDQIRVKYNSPTIKMKESLFPKHYEYNISGEVTGAFEIDREKTLRAFIVEITGLFWKFDESTNPARIRTADDLFKAQTDSGLEELVDELYNFFTGLLNNRVNEKNSE